VYAASKLGLIWLALIWLALIWLALIWPAPGRAGLRSCRARPSPSSSILAISLSTAAPACSPTGWRCWRRTQYGHWSQQGG